MTHTSVPQPVSQQPVSQVISQPALQSGTVPESFAPLALAAPGAPRSPSLSVVIPIFDEAPVLDSSLARLVAVLERIDPDFEVVCVDDGSRDASAEVLVSWQQHDPRIEVLSLARNHGKGAAVRTGMFAARGARIVCMDADLSTDLEALPRMIAALDDGADVVFGSRRAPGAELVLRQPALREWLGRGFTSLAALVLGTPISDFTCGFKGFRLHAARDVFARCELDGWAFDAEVACASKSQELTLVEVPVTWEHRGGSKVRLSSAVPSAAFDLGRIALRRVLKRYA
ncbi:MAG: glycosyltransferase family 2 protein [bacterium]|nr:glycosyltransferase family 2 protein [bacterium]